MTIIYPHAETNWRKIVNGVTKEGMVFILYLSIFLNVKIPQMEWNGMGDLGLRNKCWDQKGHSVP